MNDFLRSIITPQVEFEGSERQERFLQSFCDLYRIELFKDGLDLILTKMQEKHLGFEIKIVKGWDTNVGCFLTERKTFYDKTLGKFLHKSSQKIILRQLSCNVLAHEMAHALELESGLDLGEDFRKAIGFDMKDREPALLTLKAEIKRLMVEALKSYKQHQFLSELFARYFELLSISRNVCTTGSFATSDVMEFFQNTTNFLEKVFNPKIRPKINSRIAQITSELVTQVRLTKSQEKFQEKIESSKNKTWSKSVQSNARWQSGWKSADELGKK